MTDYYIGSAFLDSNTDFLLIIFHDATVRLRYVLLAPLLRPLLTVSTEYMVGPHPNRNAYPALMYLLYFRTYRRRGKIQLIDHGC